MKRYLSLFSLLWLLCACTPNTHVEFTPSKGDKADYWVQSSIEVKLGSHTLHQHSSAMMHYEVTDVSPTLKLDLLPKYMTISGGESHFSSLQLADSDPDLYQLLSKGFEITLNNKTGEVLAFRGKDKESWQKAIERAGQQFADQLSQGLDSPGVLQRIPAQEGSKLTLEGFKGLRTELLVTKVTPEILEAELSANEGDSRLYGRIRLEREKGWLQHMVLILDTELQAMGQQGHSHLRIITARAEQLNELNEVGNLEQLPAFNDIERWNTIKTLPPELREEKSKLSAKQLFQYGKGEFLADSEQVRLNLLLTGNKLPGYGEFSFKDMQALDAENKPVALEFATLSQFGPYQEEENLLIQLDLLPMGWYQNEILHNITRFEANIDYTPLELVSVSSRWNPEQIQQLALADGTLTITPIDQQAGEYLLHFRSDSDGYLLPFFEGLDGEFRYLTPKGGPEWLNSMDRSLLFPGQQQLHLTLTQPPSEATFYAFKSGKHPAFSHKVHWVTREEFASDYTLPPMAPHYYLYAHTTQTPIDFDPDNFSTQADTPQGVRLTLPADWASMCVVQVDGEVNYEQHPLQWIVQKESRDAQQVHFQLTTDDGIRRYFYGLKVPSLLHCESTPRWHQLDYHPSERPWLIPLAFFNDLDLQQSVPQFLQHYRLYNAQGSLLPLMDRHANILNSEEVPLSQAVVEDKYLRVAGKVTRISQLEYQGEALDIRWVNDFPPLP